MEGREKKKARGSTSPSPRFFPNTHVLVVCLIPGDLGTEGGRWRSRGGTKGMWNPQEDDLDR